MKYLWLIVFAAACKPQPNPEVAQAAKDIAMCESKLAEKVIEAANCNEAQFKVDAVLATMKECSAYPHFEVCALLDGGTNADH